MSSSDADLHGHRLGGLQDAVYGIAMTLLVLELKLPGLGEHADNAALWQALLQLTPRLLIWALSFWVLGVFWAGNARTLAFTPTVDRATLRIALAQLALVSLLPFSTALIGEHGNRVAPAVLYALHIAGLAALSAWQLVRLMRDQAAVTPRLVEFAVARRRVVIGTLCCALLAAALGFLVPGYNMLALLPAAALPYLWRPRAA
jgi:uncharacterized membrane protein